MSKGLDTSLACDYIASAKITTSTTASSQVFTPADGPRSGLAGKVAAIVSNEITIHNTDATNAVWIRFATLTNETASAGIANTVAGTASTNVTGGQSFGTQPISVDATHFVAATLGTLGELYVPPGAIYTVRVKAVGLSIVAVAGTPVVNLFAVGAANLS